MNISQDTILKVNSFMISNFKNKGNIGYSYFKLLLEISYENYKNTGYVHNLTVSEIIKEANVPVSPETCRKAISYFFKLEGIEESIKIKIMETLEQIIISAQTQTQMIEEDEF